MQKFFIQLALTVASLTFCAQDVQAIERDYFAPVTEGEMIDINYVVNTLGVGTFTSILKARSNLKEAGRRIEHVHPLRFLMTVFTDDTLKVSMRLMQKRNWIWSEFMGGLHKRMDEEASRYNMQESFVLDFASQIGIDKDVIYPLVYYNQWDALVSTLINNSK
jgi:hypothetical protein